jgi:cytochrome c biogenesis protein CcmG, thiol:disulfide interchange protein DsbE
MRRKRNGRAAGRPPDPGSEAGGERRAAARAERSRRVLRRRGIDRVRGLAVGVVVAAAAIVVIVGLLRNPGPSGVAIAGDLRIGGRLEELTLPALEGGGAVEYAAYADRPLVINFFASWCPNCIAEMPEFERVHALLGERVAFLGISQSDARGASVALARKTGITYETAIDEHGEFFNAIGGFGMPTTVFILPGGEIAEVWAGALNAEALRDLVAEHLGVVA